MPGRQDRVCRTTATQSSHIDSMLIGILLNAGYWVGIALLMARLFHDAVARLLATAVVGFILIVIALEVLSSGSTINLRAVSFLCGLTLLSGIMLHRRRPADGPDRHVTATGGTAIAGAHGLQILRSVSALIAGFAIWSALDCLLYGLFTPVQVDSDAPIYHLPFAIHWAKIGRLEFIPTPFGEEGAPYFPANGDLWLAWLMLTCGGLLIKMGQWPFLVIGGVALYGIARQTGATRESATISAGIWCCLPLTLRQSSVANVDLIWTTFYFIALYFGMRFGDAGRSQVQWIRDLSLAALSIGIVLGTKSVGLVFAPLLLIPLARNWIHGWSATCGSTADGTRQTEKCLSVSHGRSVSVWVVRISILITGILLPSVYWYGRNIGMTGNPLYPLNISWFDYRILAGVYDSSAMRATAYHIPVHEWQLLAARLQYIIGPYFASVWIVCVMSGLLRATGGQGKVRQNQIRMLSLVAMLYVGLYWYVVPYNSQERFLLPALGIGFVPLSRVLSDWQWLGWPLGLVFLGHVSLVFLGDETALDHVSFRTLQTLIQNGCGWRGAALVGSLVLAGTLLAGNRRSRWMAASVAVVVGCCVYGKPLADVSSRHPERSFYPETGFGARMADAWHIVERASGPTGARVAYAGGNLPYYLLGMNYRNDAVYVNINGHRDWLPHDYHTARRLEGEADTAVIPWPQWYREQVDYQAWLENLRTAQIDLLFVSRVNLHGHIILPPLELAPFPIEREWADAHPEEFEKLGPEPVSQGTIPWNCVYRLRK